MASNTFINEKGEVKFNDCHFFLNEKLESLPSWIGTINTHYS
jgi:hypothetical protein